MAVENREMGDRERWLGVLEIVALRRPDEAEAEWAWVMKELGLGPEYFLPVLEAVRQGRWREAENPAGYLKTAAMREAKWIDDSGERKPRGLRGCPGLVRKNEEITLGRGKPVETEDERYSTEDILDNLQYGSDSGKPITIRDGNGRWRTAPGAEADHEGLLSRRAVKGRPRKAPPEGAMARLVRYAEKLEQIRKAQGRDERDTPYLEREPERDPDWPRLAQAAGLGEWEKKVCEYKYLNVGWRKAVAQQPDEASRRALRAAWRKMDRTGMKRLKEAERKVNAQQLDRTQNPTTDDTDWTDLH